MQLKGVSGRSLITATSCHHHSPMLQNHFISVQITSEALTQVSGVQLELQRQHGPTVR